MIDMVIITDIIIYIMPTRMPIANSKEIVITAGEARQSLGELMNRAYYGGERFVVQRAGTPMIRIERVEEDAISARKQLREMNQELADAFENVSEGEGNQLINEAIAAVRSR